MGVPSCPAQNNMFDVDSSTKVNGLGYYLRYMYPLLLYIEQMRQAKFEEKYDVEEWKNTYIGY